jgi:hypothetical protein
MQGLPIRDRERVVLDLADYDQAHDLSVDILRLLRSDGSPVLPSFVNDGILRSAAYLRWDGVAP